MVPGMAAEALRHPIAAFENAFLLHGHRIN
jgi:hypothetical protein